MDAKKLWLLTLDSSSRSLYGYCSFEYVERCLKVLLFIECDEALDVHGQSGVL